MIDLEEKLVSKIAERCENLRKNTTYRQDDIADKASISKIENAKYASGDNFITDTVLESYSAIFNISKEEIIFGNEEEIEKLLEELFEDLFRLISRRPLDTDMSYYREGAYNALDVEVQKAVVNLASSFAEYNLQRYNFLNTKEPFMDCVNKEFDCYIYVNGKAVNIERDWRSEPINEKTVIDQSYMSEKIWLICKYKLIRSFKNSVINNSFDEFKYSIINHNVNIWIKNQFINIIVPELIEKLKSNSILKIGYMVKNLIDEFLNENLSDSFQKTIPIQTIRPKHYELSFGNNASFSNLSKDEEIKRNELILEAMTIAQNGRILDLKSDELDEYERYGIYFKEIPEIKMTREVDIDAIINQAIISKNFNKTRAEFLPSVEVSPIIKTSNFESEDDIRAFYDDWHDSTRFANMNIPGYLTNNSQISQRWQQRLNEEISESVEVFIIIQNNLLKLLTDEELIKFGK
ncbi:hypothetical protein [Listeria fleischmannii]|uniref:hypothetical protein n=1 Tax=Listeria fleischmannii TaxID=1069827 RepID=UPI000254F6B3|nr:hypothetical protein [Listeria fleischmannii]EIA20725.1 hypothetical protein KKC_05352 [Listeria fleischmannii subsp. coloradonensis]STY35363.1 Uncharacterised protein [Listeria fleischmannii subsp. coloradonensis]